MNCRLLPFGLAPVALAVGLAFQEPGPPAPVDEAREALEAAFLEQGLRVDLREGFVVVPVEIGVREDLLEYLLVGQYGASHESLLFTEVVPSALNAVLLALGAEPGTNAIWREIVPPPTREERQAGAPVHDVTLPEGDAFYLHVAWRQGDELYFYRLEDLIGNLSNQRSLERHAFVYLGSRMIVPGPGKPEAFAADLEGNLINLSYFRSGTTLLTAAVPEAVEQTIWLPNAMLLPPRGSDAHLVISRTRLDCLPEALAAGVPQLDAPVEDAGAEER